ncbi:RagB/SusD family nutrient uptake outer membrane protein [Psychroflexus sp. CAK57W]|uniref:RagB/SusD family nutrient uptake outer membrane protein n=1 Tax=Psychroflexus curvus TaxID=2873595 RepID=UPI001CCA0FE4|nr:RagB/SusD family nutrient uptake outer membrane protein [Psychroflexus curvus]MBZ9788278.1 RagB/SusD family nutrient uptake outer membrane protein [Psychroflexus curvus]
MKNIKIIFGLVIAFTVLSCEDAYKIDQPGRLTADVAFETEADLQLGLTGMYNQLDLTPEIALSSYFTDEVSIGESNGGQALALYAFQITAASTSSANFWVRNYAVINTANRIIEAGENVEGDAAAVASIVGQARAVRAFAHFELLTYYSTDLTNDDALGVYLVDFVPTIDQLLMRSTNAEVFGLIESDLTFAASNIIESDSRYLFSKNAIKALQARVAAFRGDYPRVRTLAEDLTAIYPLADADTYFDMFVGDPSDTRGESIFELARTVGDTYDGQGATGSVAAGGWAGARYAFGDPTIDGSPYLEMDRGLYNEFAEGDGVRLAVNLNETATIDTNWPGPDYNTLDDILVIGKYPGSNNQPLMNDLQVFRAADMHLLLAEAFAFADNYTEVASLIKELRDTRAADGGNGPLPSYSSRQEALAAILAERRLEFAFEGHRYRDLKRLGVAAGVGIDRADTDCEPYGGNCELAASDYRFTLPLPIVEFNANPDLREQQNPGY